MLAPACRSLRLIRVPSSLMNRSAAVTRSVRDRNEGLLHGILIHPYEVADRYGHLHIITGAERIDPQFIFQIGDQDRDTREVETSTPAT